MAQIRAESAQLPSDASLKRMDNHFTSLRRSNSLLRTISPLSIESRMSLVANTPMEQKLFKLRGEDRNDEMRLLQQRAPYSGKNPLQLSEEVLAQLSPARGHDLAWRVLQKKENLAKNSSGICRSSRIFG